VCSCHDGRLDHLAIDSNGPALFVGLEHPVRPGDVVPAGTESVVDRFDVVRVDEELAVEAEFPGIAGVVSRSLPIVLAAESAMRAHLLRVRSHLLGY